MMVFISHLPYAIDAEFLAFLKYKFGRLGVEMFFVLSGFLITSILLKEKELTNTISLRKFWIRRIFRIFPLYFAVLFLILLLSTLTGEVRAGAIPEFLKYYFTFMGNFDRIVNDVSTVNSFIGSGVLWSIGVEEQFYLIFPVLVWAFRAHKQSLVRVFMLCYSITLVSKVLLIHAFPLDDALQFRNLQFNPLSAFDGIIVGCLLATIAYYYKKHLQLWIDRFNYATIILVVLAFLLVLYAEYFFENIYFSQFIAKQLYIISFVIIITFTCFHHSASTKSSNTILNTLNYLGKISFGLYLFHVIIIHYLKSSIQSELLLFGVSLICSIAISWISYNYFEYPLLRFKEKFAVVRTRKL